MGGRAAYDVFVFFGDLFYEISKAAVFTACPASSVEQKSGGYQRGFSCRCPAPQQKTFREIPRKAAILAQLI
jgi:hypothetical protein